MEIQKDKDFTSLPEIAKLYQACKERDLTIAEREYLKGARDAWQAAKAHEAERLKGCVLVPVQCHDPDFADSLFDELSKKAIGEFGDDLLIHFSDIDEEKIWALMVEAAKAQAVPEGFVLVPESKISHFWQDNDEPENLCIDASSFDSLGDCIDDGEVMIVNKFTQANISKQKMFGVWCACEPKPFTRFIKEFKLFDTQEEAEQAMIQAQEQGHERQNP